MIEKNTPSRVIFNILNYGFMILFSIVCIVPIWHVIMCSIKMNEWYEKGYIYQDFASRTGDAFYTPNPSMVNSGAVGIWYGMTAQLDNGLEMSIGVAGADVRPLKPPVNEKDPDSFLGINMLYARADSMDSNGYVVSTECSKEKLIRWPQICDFLFSEEGAMLRTYGLDEEHGSAECTYNQELGLEKGYYVWDEDGNYVENPAWSGTTDHNYYNILTGYRLPGVRWNQYELEQLNETIVNAQEVWGTYGFENTIPTSINSYLTEDEYTAIKDYAAYYSTELDVWTVKYIMGTEELTEESFENFCKTMENLGTEEATKLKQKAYDRSIGKE